MKWLYVTLAGLRTFSFSGCSAISLSSTLSCGLAEIAASPVWDRQAEQVSKVSLGMGETQETLREVKAERQRGALGARGALAEGRSGCSARVPGALQILVPPSPSVPVGSHLPHGQVFPP